MTRVLAFLCAAVAFAFAGGSASAQGYPNKPINFIIQFAPGGPSDVLARIVTHKMGEILNATFVIENRPGANGTIAAQFVANAPPDGYTVLLATQGVLATNKFLYNIPYDPEKDFELVSIIGQQPNILYVHPSVPVRTFQQFVDFAKANPGQLNYATGGNGTSSHLAGELVKTQAKVSITHVPFRGTGPALQAVLAGHVQAGMNPPPPLLQHFESGALFPLAATSLKRSSALPSVPAVSELGYPGFEAVTWHSLVVPAGTPKEIVMTLHRALMDTLNDPSTRKQLTDLGVEIIGNTPDEFRAYLKDEIVKWGNLVKAANVKGGE